MPEDPLQRHLYKDRSPGSMMLRFKVRLRCEWAMSGPNETPPDLPIRGERVLAAELREVEIQKLVSGGRCEV